MGPGVFGSACILLVGFAPGSWGVVVVRSWPVQATGVAAGVRITLLKSPLGQQSGIAAGGLSSANTGLPASFASLTTPNLASVPSLADSPGSARWEGLGPSGNYSGPLKEERGGGRHIVAPPPSASAGPVLRNGQVRQPKTLAEKALHCGLVFLLGSPLLVT